MKSLEDILEEIKILKSDLRAEIVLQEAEGHWEEEKGHWESTLDSITDMYTGFIQPNPNLPPRLPTSREIEESNIWVIDEPGKWIIDKPRIAKPNEKKREGARFELQKIYESSKWYSVRYVAGESLSYSLVSTKIVDSWFALLQNEFAINREKAEQDLRGFYENVENRGIISKAGRLLRISEPDILSYIQDVFERKYHDTILSKDELRFVYTSASSPHAREKSGDFLIDRLSEETRAILKSRDKSKKINRDPESLKAARDELKDIYRNSEFRNLRKKAGEALGYSWAHEHPVAAIVTGIAYTGLISALVYYIYHIIE